MEWREAACSGNRGGANIPTLRALPLRVAISTVAVGLATTLAVYPITVSDKSTPLLVVVGALGVGCVLIAALAHGRMTGAALVLLAGEYAIVDVNGDVGTGTVIAYAATLLLIAELLLMSAATPSAALVDRRLLRKRGVALAAVASVGLLLALVTLVAGTWQLPALEATAIGTVAATALLATPLLLLR